jgi:hypothetical protein
MPGLSWSSLQVVAADGLVGDRGVALRTPILKDEGGRLFLPAGVEGETVASRQWLSVDEVRGLLDGGAWIPVQPMQAKRGHVIVLRAAPFAGACRMVGLGDGLRWEDHHGRIDIAYVDRSAAAAWRARCAEHLVRRATRAIGEHLGAFWYPPSLATAQTLLEMAMFVTSAGTPTRHRAFVLLGVISAERPLASWPMLETTALFESPGLGRAQFFEEVEATRHDLKARAERPSPRPWAGITPWRQPAIIY